mgnify:CR=1 FL=1
MSDSAALPAAIPVAVSGEKASLPPVEHERSERGHRRSRSRSPRRRSSRERSRSRERSPRRDRDRRDRSPPRDSAGGGAPAPRRGPTDDGFKLYVGNMAFTVCAT